MNYPTKKQPMNDHGTHLNASKKYPGTISENLPVKKKKKKKKDR